MAAKKAQLIDLSFMSIVKFFLVVALFIFLYLIQEVLAILFVSLILSSAIDPMVDVMQKKLKFARWLGVLIIYAILFAIIFGVVYLLIPPLIEQTKELAEFFPSYFDRISSAFQDVKAFSNEYGILDNINRGMESIKGGLGNFAGGVVGTIAAIFGGIVSFFIVLVMTLYMTVEESALKRTITFVCPDEYHDFVMQLINKIQAKIGDWLKGQLLLCLVIGILSYIGLTILGVKYALLLALVACIGEFVPYLGPALTSVPAIFIAFTQSPVKALFVLALYVIIQQMENHLLVPKVMQKAVGLNPIISIIALLIGAKIGGFVGILLAIPVATAINVIVKEVWITKEKIEVAGE